MHAEQPHFSYPFRRDREGKPVVDEQDTTEHIMSCVNVIVRCPRGWRDERPEYGWPFPEFGMYGTGLEELNMALSESEPRADSVVTEKGLEELADQATREVTVSVETEGPSDA
jgi:hypothetical protein